MPEFTWLPFFEKMLSVICRQYDKNSLCKVFHQIFKDVGGTKDKYKNDVEGPLKEIDPLTFIAYFNRSMTNDNRIRFCSTAQEILHLKSNVPSDFDGIPSLQNQNTWFFGWAKSRGPNDIDTLWALGKQICNDNVKNSTFASALKIKYVALGKLTTVMFICKPNTYLSLDSTNVKYLESQGIKIVKDKMQKTSEPLKEYQQFLKDVQGSFSNTPFYQVSYNAYLYREEQKAPHKKHKVKEDDSQKRYWLITPGQQGRLWDRWKTENIISVGWEKLGNLSEYKTKEAICDTFKKAYASSSIPHMKTLACYEFANVMKPDDIVIVRKGSKHLLGYGKVVGIILPKNWARD